MSAPEIRFPSAGNSTPEIVRSVEDEAAHWLVRRNAGLSPMENEAFRLWLSSDPRHAEAFARHEKTWAALNHPRISGQASSLARELDRRQERRARRTKAYAFASLGLAAAAVFLFALLPPRSQTPGSLPSTVAVRPNQQVLPDGSVVELNSQAEIAVSFSSEKRGVRLLKGEALFQVTKNPARPFVVTAGEVQVTAVGTAFTVRNAPTEVGVLVTEGRVAVSRLVASPAPADSSLPPPSLILSAGDKVTLPVQAVAVSPHPEKVTPAQIEKALAWRGKRVEFSGTPVEEAVALFNRQNPVHLIVADPTVGQLQLTGIFWSDDPDGFVRLLETGMNVRAERSGDSIVLRVR